jgi:hypothetical protein
MGHRTCNQKKAPVCFYISPIGSYDADKPATRLKDGRLVGLGNEVGIPE